MKAQKALNVLAIGSFLVLSVACNDRYAEGLADGKAQGYSEGYNAGYSDGDADGYARAQAYFATADYNAGFNDGKTAGISIGYNQGYAVGKTDGQALGYNTGYADGQADGYDTGYNDGLGDGYDMGYNDGVADGYDMGYDDGVADGYDIGYTDGWNDAYGLSVGPAKKLKGYSNLLSMVHNDLFDYSKIPAPKETKRGLVAGSTLLLSETSSTNKDTLKRAAVAEQYLVTEMAKQVKSKFGLSAERSLKVAKAANHFRKYATKRALTAEDTNAYAEEILGANFTAIESAYSSALKGDMSKFDSVIDQAAEKNGVSAEKMGEIVTKLFI